MYGTDKASFLFQEVPLFQFFVVWLFNIKHIFDTMISKSCRSMQLLGPILKFVEAVSLQYVMVLSNETKCREIRVHDG